MFAVLQAMWHDLSTAGRMWVLLVVILAVAGLLTVAMFLGYKLDWLPNILGSMVQ